jgi:hypothetical protein
VHIVANALATRTHRSLNVYADVIPDDDTSAVDVFRKAVWGHEQRVLGAIASFLR